MKINLSPIDDLTLSRKGVLSYIEHVSPQPFEEYKSALLNLFKCSEREIYKLIININELDYVSLHTRNIFEIYIIMLHIQSSEPELKRWYGQQHKDSTDVIQGFRKLVIKKGLDSAQLDELHKFEDDSLKNSQYKPEKNFNISHLAKTHGYGDDYGFIYRLSSKLVHPSAMKVNGYEELTENNHYLTVVVQSAVYFSQKLEKLANEALENVA